MLGFWDGVTVGVCVTLAVEIMLLIVWSWRH